MAADMQHRFALMGGRLDSRKLERSGDMELTFAAVCFCDPSAQGASAYNKQLDDRIGTKLVTASL